MFRNDSIGAAQASSNFPAAGLQPHASGARQNAASNVSVALGSVRNVAEAAAPIQDSAQRENPGTMLIAALAWNQDPGLASRMCLQNYCFWITNGLGPTRYVRADGSLTTHGEKSIANMNTQFPGGLQGRVDALRAERWDVFGPYAPPDRPMRVGKHHMAILEWLRLQPEEQDRRPLAQHLSDRGIRRRVDPRSMPSGLIESIAWQEDAGLRMRIGHKSYAAAIDKPYSCITQFVYSDGTPTKLMDAMAGLRRRLEPQVLQAALDAFRAQHPALFGPRIAVPAAMGAAQGVERGAAAPVPAPAAQAAPPPTWRPWEPRPPVWQPWQGGDASS